MGRFLEIPHLVVCHCLRRLWVVRLSPSPCSRLPAAILEPRGGWVKQRLRKERCSWESCYIGESKIHLLVQRSEWSCPELPGKGTHSKSTWVAWADGRMGRGSGSPNSLRIRMRNHLNVQLGLHSRSGDKEDTCVLEITLPYPSLVRAGENTGEPEWS